MQNIRFEVSINDEVVATAGIDGYGVLTAILCWASRDPGWVPEHVQEDTAAEQAQWLEEDLRLQVGGLSAAGNLNWADQSVTSGDEIRIRVLPSGTVDDAEVSPAICEEPPSE